MELCYIYILFCSITMYHYLSLFITDITCGTSLQEPSRPSSPVAGIKSCQSLLQQLVQTITDGTEVPPRLSEF